jgi:small subunit ribosomal protein S16
VAVKIRLKRLGKIRTPHYRIVVMDSRTKRDGRAIEEIGIYHPKNDPSVIQVKSERVQYWLGVVAQPTEAVVAILKRTGDWQQFSGDETPSGVEPQKPRKSKVDLFNLALAEADAEPTTSAISKSRKQQAAEEAAEAAAEAAEEAEAVPAPEPAAEAPAEAPAEEPAAEAPAEEA